MARYEFSDDQAPDDWAGRASPTLNLVVRVCGLVLLLVGFVVTLMVIVSAWSLYSDPERIEELAWAVERGSRLDLTLSSAAQQARTELEPEPVASLGVIGDATSDDGTAPVGETAAAKPGAATVGPQLENGPRGLRFSYFIAWAIAILLLLLIGRLGLAAIKTGGELALYDVKVGRLARALLRERLRSDSVS